MRIVMLLLIFVTTNVTVAGQRLSKKMVYQCFDSTVWNARKIYVNTPQDFLIEKENGDTIVFITEKGPSEPFKHIGGRGTLSKYQKIADTVSWFYRSNVSQLYGPVHGEDLIDFKHPLSDNEHFFAVPVLNNDSIRIYVNGKQVVVIDTFTTDRWNINFKTASQLRSKSASLSSGYDKWIALSNNGNSIYSIENNLLFKLYINGELKDSAKKEFSDLMINDQGDYTYGGYENYSSGDSLKSVYTIFIADSVIKTDGYFNNRYLGPQGAYFLSGRRNKKEFILINNYLIDDVGDVDNIRFTDSKHFLFTYKRDGTPYINVNGKSRNISNYKNVYYPIIDKNGNYAYYGLRDYHLYKIVNSIESGTPISAYGVRALPLYISADGRSTHLFITDDSSYLYQDNQLLIPPANNHTDSIFVGEAYYTFFDQSYGKRDEPREDRRLLLVTVNNVSYMIYEGMISRPMLRVEEQNYGVNKVAGEIVCSEINKYGFFLIQKTGPKSFLININNVVYHNLDEVDFILDRYSKFNGKELIFNGIIDQSLYQFNFKR